MSTSPDRKRPFFVLRLIALAHGAAVGFWNLVSDGLKAIGDGVSLIGLSRFAGALYHASGAALSSAEAILRTDTGG